MEHNDELNKIKAENLQMKAQLDKIDKHKKHNFIIAIAVCIIGIIVSSILVFSFSGDAGKYNGSLKEAGAENTKIVFSNKTFYPANKTQSYILLNAGYYDSEFDDKKYADFYGKDNKPQKVIVFCASGNKNGIVLKVKNKRYVYIEKKLKNRDVKLERFDLVRLSRESKFSSVDEVDYFGSSLSIYEKEDFEKFYQNKGDSVNNKTVEAFLGNKPITVRVYSQEISDISFSDVDGSNLTLGEFFKDDKDNAYFYDYITEKAYKVGKELKDSVYSKN